MFANIDNTNARIDSREVISEIEYLEGLVEDDIITREEMRDLDTLRSLASKGEEYAEDWEYGATLIRFDNFTEYVKEYMGEVNGEELENMPEIFRKAIDWDTVAEELMVDYSEIDYEGITYYARTKTA